MRKSSKRIRKFQTAATGYLFALPWILGFIIFFSVPLVLSVYYSFTDYDFINEPTWVGFENYKEILFSDKSFSQAVSNTLFYVGLSVPINLIGALLIAVLLNRPLKGVTIVRTIVYLPAVLSGVAMAVAWKYMFNPDYGIINWLLSLVGIEGPSWLMSMKWAKPAFVIMAFWTIGPVMIIFLAALQNVPKELYEVADIDGAGFLKKFTTITMPMISPAIFFNTITLIIASFNVFEPAWVLTTTMNSIGAPGGSTLFYVVYLFWVAFVEFRFGYATALAWLLTLVLLVITFIQFIGARKWVYYGGER